jgi:branched-chain amino acid transport system permease protein
MSLNIFLQNLSNGISLGCLFALIAIGYTMVYGILRLPFLFFMLWYYFLFPGE